MGAAARRMQAALDVMLFQVGEGLFGVDLSKVEGVIQDVPKNPDRVCFHGQDIPLFSAADLMPGLGSAEGGREALVFRDHKGYYAVTVQSTEGVVQVAPGVDFYAFPPDHALANAPCRPWGWFDNGSRLVLLVDVDSGTVH